MDAATCAADVSARLRRKYFARFSWAGRTETLVSKAPSITTMATRAVTRAARRFELLPYLIFQEERCSTS